jgi:hypothetical protein
MSFTQFLQTSFCIYFLYPSLALLVLAYLQSRRRKSLTTFWVTLGIVSLGFVIGVVVVELRLHGVLAGQ